MLKKFAARIGATVSAAALVGSVFAAVPAGPANAAVYCTIGYPQARTTTAVSAPYGVSASVADQITVKAINSTSQVCIEPRVIIYPREGFVFHSIVSTTGGWLCKTPVPGDAGPTSCINETLPKYSSSTIRLRYDRVTPGGPVSGTASSELILGNDCPVLTLEDPAVCSVN